MPSCQRILADCNNAVAGVVPTASSIRAATDQVFPVPAARTGTGNVRLSGGYTGADDATIEVEIRPASGAAARVTQPAFSGAGNGTMTQPSAANGAASQEVTVTLVDLGIRTTFAQAILYANVLLRARTPGAGGNAITLSLAPALALTQPPIGALAEALARDTQEWSDQRLDFGAVPLNPDGTVPTTAPRLVFGRDLSQVYRHYKRWDGDRWQYGVSPRLAAAYPKDAPVHAVTGGYSATLSTGATVEIWNALVSLYDLLLALSSSALVELATPPANDRKPGGMAAVDLPIRTSAFALPIDKSRPELPDLVGLTVAATAPTEVVTVECTNNNRPNDEVWAVHDPVAGNSEVRTGASYSGGFVGFTVPKVPLEASPITGSIAIADTKFAGAGDPKTYPTACLYRPELGIAATAKTLTLVWTARPNANCDCTQIRVTGRPKPDYLGLDLGDASMAALAAGHQARLETLAGWHKTFVAGNTAITTAGELRAADLDLQLAQSAVDELADCLSDLYESPDATLQSTVHANNTAYALYQTTEPATRNGYRYRCTVAGTSGSSPPTWPTTIGNTVVDGTVTWTCVSKIPESAWDDVLSGLQTDLTALATLGSELTASISTLFSDSPRSFDYLGTAPVEGTSYTGVATDGTVHSYKAVSVYVLGTNTNFGLPPSFVTGGLETVSSFENTSLPTWGYRIIWQDEGQVATASDINRSATEILDPGILRDPETWSQRYLAACNHVRTLAGLLPKADAGQTTANGNGVWSDPGDPYYWVIQGTNYLPVFNDRYYHACVRQCGGDIVPTYEFGFALQIGCPGALVEGDTVTLAIAEPADARPYRVGDTYTIAIVRGAPLALSGGVTGTDTLTWLVRSSQGVLADYALSVDETPYDSGGLSFAIHRGGLPFALGDAFRFAVEAGGQFRWRKDAGAWSADTVITASIALGDGLTAIFAEGPAPSFVSGDLYRFLVRQPYSPAHTQSADGQTWQWTGASATLTCDFGSSTTVECLGVLRHALTSGATLTLTLQDAGGAPLYSFSPTVRPGPLLIFPPAPVIARRLVVSVSNAPGMALGWVYAGAPWAALYSADECILHRAYALERGAGLDPSSAYLGAGRGGELRWNDWFQPTDWTSLLALLDDVKTRGDAPVVVTPNLTDVADAALVRIATDTLEITDEYRFQDPTARMMSLTLPLTAVVV